MSFLLCRLKFDFLRVHHLIIVKCMMRLALKIEYFKIAVSNINQFNFEVDLMAVMWSLKALYKLTAS